MIHFLDFPAPFLSVVQDGNVGTALVGCQSISMSTLDELIAVLDAMNTIMTANVAKIQAMKDQLAAAAADQAKFDAAVAAIKANTAKLQALLS